MSQHEFEAITGLMLPIRAVKIVMQITIFIEFLFNFAHLETSSRTLHPHHHPLTIVLHEKKILIEHVLLSIRLRRGSNISPDSL